MMAIIPILLISILILNSYYRERKAKKEKEEKLEYIKNNVKKFDVLSIGYDDDTLFHDEKLYIAILDIVGDVYFYSYATKNGDGYDCDKKIFSCDIDHLLIFEKEINNG